MKKKVLSHNKKTSTSESLASCPENNSALESLQMMIEGSKYITQDMSSIIRQLRQSGIEVQQVSSKIKDNEQYIKNIFDKCSDIVIREIKITNNPKYSALLVYIDGMVKQELIEDAVVKKMVSQPADSTYLPASKEYVQYLIGIRPEDIYEEMSQVIEAILSSKIIVFVDGVNSALTIDFKNPPTRNVEQPEAESSLRGPKEGFTESIRTSTGLLRKKIKNINLKMESYKIGRETKTDIVVCYLAGIANDKIVNEVRERLHKIDIDSVLGSSYIEAYIEDSPFFIFPTIFRTEKPDVVAGKLLEGHIAIIVDGTPVAITVPCLFVDFIKTADDYYLKFIPATLSRWIRFGAFFINLTLTGFYVALLTFHQELIPDSLVPSLIKSRAGVPLPVMWESFALLFTYEVLREAGIRMPRVVGPAVSIVGALVLGQSAVDAGLVSTLTVVVIGFTAIAALTVPYPEMSMSLIYPRFIFLFLGGTLGMLGLTGGIMMLFMNMISARSFGVPYMGPLAPLVKNELSDVVIRAPLWSMLKRSKLITWKQSIRKKTKVR
ncbi:spore germination protein [Pelosinus sp. UFO1]|uniref:spore germination protein n=1 Tax=Pelosinus sp. UFO1 TaxID=484770 RepID=UPI0004D0BF5C|nr:spore germination protein [Pelosinus sp. UFO1]AIF50341.1 GerA spore germination protein [Pelosinus sp. UFO1]